MDAFQIRDTYPIRAMTSRAEVIMNTAGDHQLKKVAKNVYEELRYSDPVSNIMLEDINLKINSELYEFEEAVISGDHELAVAIAKTLIDMIKERNVMCKGMK